VIGRVIDHYKVREQIGSGTYGDVYLAVNLRVRAQVAIKILRPAFLRDVLVRRELAREARVLARLHHPNVVQIIDYVEEPDLDALIMEYAEGEPLDRVIARGPLDERVLLRYALQACEGLEAAHAHDVVHRDIKPSNIRVNSNGWLKLLDFGLAQLVAQSQSATMDVSPGDVAGTRPYIAPEIWLNGEATAASDLYSLGVVLYEMAAGALPFPGPMNDALLYAILNQPPPPLANLNPPISPDLEVVITKLLAKDPEDRYGSARELHAVLDDLETRHKSSSGRAKAAPTAPRKSRRRWVVASTLAIAVTIAATLLYGRMSRPLIAVLAAVPFDITDSTAVYFADGVSRDVTSMLAECGSPQVIAWASMRKYRNSTLPLPEIAQAVGADALVTGTIERTPHELLLHVELVDGRKGNLIKGWEHSVPTGDVVDLERQAALAVFKKVNPHSPPPTELKRAPSRAVDRTALDLLYLGLNCLDRRNQDDIIAARSYFQRSLERDSTNAQAWSALADAWGAMAYAGFERPRVAFPQARRAADRAIELDRASADARASLGNILQNYDRDWDAAEAEFRKALELNPNHATSHHWLASNLAMRGRVDEARREIAQARRLDPNSLPIAVAPAAHLYFARRYAEALDSLQAATRMDPKSALVLRLRAGILDRLGRQAEGIAALRLWLDGARLQPVSAAVGRAYAAGGFPAAVRVLIAALEQKRASGAYEPATHIAELHARLGEREPAMRWLLTAEMERDTELNRLLVDPVFDTLRADPRFEALVDRVGLDGSQATPHRAPNRPGQGS
jgi:serine/threonine-protein kinase